MPAHGKIALFDLDRTLADFEGKLRADMAELSSLEMPPIGTVWPAEYFKISEMVKRQAGWWETLPPISAGLEIFRYCAQAGFQNYVLTQASKGADNSWTEKARWCTKHLQPITPNFGVTMTMNFIGDNRRKDEWESGKRLNYGRILVDDHVPFMEGWLEHRPRGLGLMPRYKTNEGFSHPNVIFYNNNEPLSAEVKLAIDRAFARPAGE